MPWLASICHYRFRHASLLVAKFKVVKVMGQWAYRMESHTKIPILRSPGKNPIKHHQCRSMQWSRDKPQDCIQNNLSKDPTPGEEDRPHTFADLQRMCKQVWEESMSDLADVYKRARADLLQALDERIDRCLRESRQEGETT